MFRRHTLLVVLLVSAVVGCRTNLLEPSPQSIVGRWRRTLVPSSPTGQFVRTLALAPDGHYTDVPAPEEGAFGPAEVTARLKLGIAPLAKYVLHDGPIVADGDMVITEHHEEWFWESGEHVDLPFVSVHEIRDGQIVRWHDYLDLNTLLSAAPAAWLEHIMVGYK